MGLEITRAVELIPRPNLFGHQKDLALVTRHCKCHCSNNHLFQGTNSHRLGFRSNAPGANGPPL